MARPSKYNPVLQKKFDDLVDSIGDISIKDAGKERKIQITRLIEEFFTYGDINSIAVYLDIRRETIHDWVKESSDRYNVGFSNTFKRWNEKRKSMLFKITPFIDKSLAIFFNKAINGYIEVQGLNVKTEISQKVEIRLKVDNIKETYGKQDLIELDRILSQKRQHSIN